MALLDARLFGRFAVDVDGRAVPLGAHLKAQELFAFLLLYPRRRHTRDDLVTVLWDGESATQGRKHLRQALWLLHRAMKDGLTGPTAGLLPNMLLVGPDAIELDPADLLSLDTQSLESAYAAVRGIAGRDLAGERLRALDRAAPMTFDILEGWTCEWALAPREYYRTIALASFDKLLAAYETCGDLDAAVSCADRLFLAEPAHEPAHRAMMRLYHRAGNRAAALRQFEHCRIALARGFDAQPDRQTVALFAAIRADSLVPELSPPPAELDLGTRLDRLYLALTALHSQVQTELIALDAARSQLT